jgi:hypothetical protein
MKPETLDKVLTLVSKASESELRAINDTVRLRYKTIQAIEASKTKAQLEPGVEVRIKRTKPQYLNGTRGTVLSIEGMWIRVELEDPDPRVLRRFNSKRMKFRSTQLEII